MTQPLFIKLYTGGPGVYEFINLMHIVSVKFVHTNCEDKTDTVTLHLINGQYRTVMDESAEKLEQALENMDPTLVSETRADQLPLHSEMTVAHTATAQNLDLGSLSSN
jgi:hypothetical protein